VGRILAERLGWPFLDSDAEVVRSTGQTVPEIFAERGEAAFRAEEARVLQEATTSDGPVVVGVAGGAVLDPDNRRRIRQAGLVIWLKADPAVLVTRVGTGAGRPLLAHDPAGTMRRLEEERRPIYSELADVTIDVDGVDAESAARRIQAALAAADA
jgi:shikimate kinase